MNGMLPPSLRVPSDSEVTEDFRELLEEIIAQNAEILKRIDDRAPVVQNVTVSGWAAFWGSAFSIWGALIAIQVAVAIGVVVTSIFGK